LRHWRGFAHWSDARARVNPRSAPELPALPAQSGHLILIGHGRVGSAITPVLAQAGLPFVVIDRDRPRFEKLRAQGVHVLLGDATQPGMLEAAGIATARVLVVATAESFQARRAVEVARAGNPGIAILARTHSDVEQSALREVGADLAVIGERELARSLLQLALMRLGLPENEVTHWSAQL